MSGNPNVKPEDVEKYYHYTDRKGAKGIKKSEKILASRDEGGTDDAAYGDGAYFTQMNPETNTKAEIAENNYDGNSGNVQAAVNQGRVDYVVEVDVPVNKAPVDVSDRGRDVHLHGDEDFDLSQHDYKIRKVKGSK